MMASLTWLTKAAWYLQRGFLRVSLADVAGDDLVGDLALPDRQGRDDLDASNVPSLRIISRWETTRVLAELSQFGDVGKHRWYRLRCDKFGRSDDR